VEKRYGSELPEGEEETESSFSGVYKDTSPPRPLVKGKRCSFQKAEQSLIQFSFALGDILSQGILSSSL